MAEYRLLLLDGGNTIDITQRVKTITLSGSIREAARTMTVDLVQPKDGSLPDLPLQLGAQLRLWADGATRYSGTVVQRSTNSQSSTLSFACLDRGWYTANNEAVYQFSGITPEKAARTVCADFGIPVGKLADTGISLSRNFSGDSLDTIINTMYKLAADQNGKRYLVRFDGLGQLEVVEKATTAQLRLGPTMGMNYTEDISNLQNSVAIYSEDGSLIRTIDDAESVALYGQLQHVLKQKDGEDASKEAQTWLEDNGPQQSVSVDCMGDPALISGAAVSIQDRATGVTGLFWIESDSHTFKLGQYYTNIKLNFRNLMNDTEGGSEPK